MLEDRTAVFYNKKRQSWERLERLNIDTEKGLISSYTTHFTDIINSTLTLPESPTPLYFNPTSLKDIKAADPGTGINLLEAPQANNQGSASLQYPIEVPPGRNGLQAQVNLQYNSDGGNGFLGLGWDVSVSSISIDTRWGVPRYDDNLETETYLLDGSQLTPLAHRTEPVARTAEKEFHTRIEDAFRKIVRHGASPHNYWWEVIDKNGLRFFYGGLPETGRIAQAVLAAGEEGPIFRWALVQMRDTHLNTVDYQYEKLWDSGTGDGSGEVKGVQLYLFSIHYTGTVGEPGPYSVRFIKDIDLNEQRRPDVSIDGRAGFKVVTASLLRRIEVKFEDRLIRAYALLYTQGAFQKTLLSGIVQYGSDGAEFCRHGLSYYDEVSLQEGCNGFAAPVEWNTGSDNISAGLWGFGRATAIGSATGDSLGGHLYAGVNPAGATKGGSAGFKVGYTRTNNNTVVALVDLNGDGLADKVFKSGNRVYYRPQMKAAGGSAFFSEPVALDTISDIGRDSSDTVSAGVESYIAVNVMANYSYTSTKSSVYFTDANGDGLVDLAADGIVYFNRLENGVPTFSPDSNGTPAPVGTGSVDATEINSGRLFRAL